MGIIKTKGMVIKESKYRDSDKILTVITPDLGKITVIAKGAKNSKGSFLPCAQLFVFSEFILYKNTGDTYLLNSAEIIEMFYSLRVDIEKVYFATYLCKIVNDISTEEENNFQILQLLLNAIYLLSENKKESMFIIVVFQIRILRLLGITPNFEKCMYCSNTKIKYFSFKTDSCICLDCSLKDKGAIELSESTINSLKYVIYSDSKKIFSFNITENVLNELKLFIKIYLKEKLDKEYDIDKYLKEILIY